MGSGKNGGKTKRHWLVAPVCAIVVLVALSGCFGTGNVAVSDCPSIPFASQGDVFTYEAEGLMGTLSDIFLVDWTIINSEGEITPVVPTGSKLEVRIGNESMNRMDIYGEKREVLQVSYWLTHADFGGPLAVHDEWIDVENGQLVQNIRRADSGHTFSDEKNDLRHSMEFYRIGIPPLYWSSSFWGKNLDIGTTETIQFPNISPYFLSESNYTLQNQSWGKLTYTVVDAERLSDGHCLFEVNIQSNDTLWGSRPGDDGFTAEFSTEHGLPQRYYYDYESEHDDRISYIEIIAHEGTDGKELPRFQEKESFKDRGMGKAKMVNGFIKDAPGLFPTSYTKAYEAIMEDDEFQKWYYDHSDARPVMGTHLMGDPDSNPVNTTISYLYSNPTSRAIDAWEIFWQTPNDDVLRVDAVRTESPPFGLPNEEIEVYIYDNAELEGLEYPGYGPNEELVTLSEIARLSEELYDEPLEVVTCFMDIKTCAEFGTHETTDRSYYRFAGGGAGVRGMGVWLDEGLILSLVAHSDDAIGPPVS